MTANTKRVGVIQLSEAQLHHPNLLTGLDFWLHLGLLSIPQVSQFCQTYLACDVSIIVNPPVNSTLSSVAVQAEAPLTDFAAPVAAPVAASEPQPVPVAAGWLTRSLQALMAEIGVIWLLCLGVFMVVVSSGVLAASQWQNFSAVGQYGILFTYTLAFWGVGLWTSRQPVLQLTTQMLQMATLLLIPVNFWMMDGLRLWQSLIGTGVSLLATLVLAGMLWQLMRVLTQPVQHRPMALNLLGLSGLHWGWSIAGLPLIAAYLGTIGTAMLTYLRQQPHRDSTASQEEPAPAVLPTLVITFALLLLLGRAVLLAQVPVTQLGLAFGICGWLFCWLTRRHRADAWTIAGAGLLIVGWTITIATDPPWQAFAISGLGLWLLADRLRQQATGLPALLLLGLQTYALLWRLLPTQWREGVFAQAVQIFGETGLPLALLSLAGFPYLWLLLWFARRLRSHQQLSLSSQTERMALVLSSIMVLLSPANPLVCALTLSGLALTLAVLLRQRNGSTLWLYGNHLLILAALAAWIDALFPQLSEPDWARLLLVGVALEWGLSIGAERLWRQSCWHFGLVLAGCSYWLLTTQSQVTVALWHPNLVWLLVPILLTGLSRLRQTRTAPAKAAWLSTGSLLAQLVLLNSVGSWMLSFAVATGLMLINTWTIQQALVAFLTIGFGLGLEATAIGYFWAEILTFERIVLLLAANLWLLWLGRAALQRRSQLVLQQYASAANIWATGLALFSLLSLTLPVLMGFIWEGSAASGQLVLAGVLIALAIADQVRRNPSELGYWGLAWAVELVAALLVDRWTGSLTVLTILTLAMGLVAQLAGDFWSQRHQTPYRMSWHLIPLVYAALGLLLGHHAFTATTGLYTLATALIGLGVGRRQVRLKPLTLASLLLVSVAFYELLVYQLSQAAGGQAGDGITLLAGLAAGIAVLLRLGQRWLLPYLRLNPAELRVVAHLHWGLGSGLVMLAILLTVSRSGFWLWLLIAGALALYALISGRLTIAQTPIAAENWTTFGIAEALALFSYAMYRTAPNSTLLAWAGTLAALIAVGLYFLPWSRWGWPSRPWLQMAIGFPAVIVVLTAGSVALQSLLIVAAFYAWIAKAERRPRLSYLSVLLFNWAAIRYLSDLDWLNLSWLSTLITGSLLYVAQLDPALQTTEAKTQRHGLRLLAVSLLSLTLFYQAEIEPQPAVLLRLLTLAFAIGLILVGLVLRVRAFLYVGTLAFMMQVVRLLWLFINQYSLLLWAIGIVIGLLFIWIAATFEARRSQVSGLMQYWLDELTSWE